MKKPLVRAVLDGAQQIAVPALVSTLSICIVFVPVLLLTGAAKYSVHPAGDGRRIRHARVLPPVADADSHHGALHVAARGGVYTGRAKTANRPEAKAPSGAPITSSTAASRACACATPAYWTGASIIEGWFLPLFGVFCVALAGSDFSDRTRLLPHCGFRPACACTPVPPAGTRLEQTQVDFAAIENEIRHVIPANELDTIIDNIGLPNGGFNLAFGDTATIAIGDGDILISLNQEKHGPIAEYTVQLRKRLNEKFPDTTFFFEAANITNQILNFGLPAPIDVQVVGRNADVNYEIATQIRDKIARIPGAADVHIHQVVDYPEIRLDVDRTKAGQVGLTQRDVAIEHAHLAEFQRPGRSESVAELGQRGELSVGRTDPAI